MYVDPSARIGLYCAYWAQNIWRPSYLHLLQRFHCVIHAKHGDHDGDQVASTNDLVVDEIRQLS